MTQAAPFYRWPMTRWAFAIVDIALAAMFSPWAPGQWHRTPSLRWLHQVMPWTFVAVMFAVAALLLLYGQILATAVADGIGVVLWGWELLACLATTHSTRVTNPFLIAGAFLALVFHLAALRLAVYQAARGDG